MREAAALAAQRRAAQMKGATPLYIVCQFGQNEAVTQLLAANANVNQAHKTQASENRGEA